MNKTQSFRVALSGAFQNDDGTAVFPMFDLSPLENDTEVEFEYVDGVDGRMTAESLEDFDALVLLLEKFDKNNVDRKSIIFEGKSNTRKEVLELYNSIDIALDPFPRPEVNHPSLNGS